MTIQLPSLPYELDALEPYISRETLQYHYAKHHQAYVNNLNNLLKDTENSETDLEKIIKTTTGPIFNNAAQVWNHSFYWQCLSPEIDQMPVGKMATLIHQTFGSLDLFKEQFTKVALSTFGSGWAWLVINPDQSLAIISTNNANTPMIDNKKALLTCDVWEHAYYIDYRNERAKYLDAFWHLVNWDFISSLLS